MAVPEEGDGRRFRLGPPRSGATRQAGLSLCCSLTGAPDRGGPLGRSLPPTPLSGVVWFLGEEAVMAVGNRKRGFGGKGKAALRAARGGDSPRISLYDEVTAKIIAQLEAG